MLRRGGDDVLAAIGSESAEPVEEESGRAPRLDRRRWIGSMRASRSEPARRGRRGRRDARLIWSASVPAPIRDDRRAPPTAAACDLRPRSVGWPNENAARPIHHIGFDARRDQPHDLIVQHLPVTGVIFVPDHEVHGESFQTPVRMGLYELADQVDVAGSAICSSTIGRSPEMA